MAKPLVEIDMKNPVAKFAYKTNKCVAYADQKRRAKKGYTKHKHHTYHPDKLGE